MNEPIAYVYEADTHCEDCALERFGHDSNGQIVGVDGSGNEVGVIAPWDEWQHDLSECEVLACGTCLCEIESYHTPKSCDACLKAALETPPYFDRFDIASAYYCFAAQHHYGQFSPGYALLSRFSTSRNLHRVKLHNPADLEENAHAIYARLALGLREIRDRR